MREFFDKEVLACIFASTKAFIEVISGTVRNEQTMLETRIAAVALIFLSFKVQKTIVQTMSARQTIIKREAEREEMYAMNFDQKLNIVVRCFLIDVVV